MNSNSPLQSSPCRGSKCTSEITCSRRTVTEHSDICARKGCCVPTSALSPLPEKMRVQGHTSLCSSKPLLSTSSLPRMPNREQQADSDLHQHQIIGAYRRKGIAGRAWSVSQDTMNNKCEPGTCCEKEAMVCERCVVYLQTHCMHLSSEAVSPLPDSCSLCCSGHPSELQSGPGIAEPQQWTCRNGACSVPVPQADAVCL